MNLATARSSLRSKEVGIRKVSDAMRLTLAGQFMGESLLLSLVSAGLAIGLVLLALLVLLVLLARPARPTRLIG